MGRNCLKRGGFGQFADLRGGLAKKKEFFFFVVVGAWGGGRLIPPMHNMYTIDPFCTYKLNIETMKEFLLYCNKYKNKKTLLDRLSQIDTELVNLNENMFLCVLLVILKYIMNGNF